MFTSYFVTLICALFPCTHHVVQVEPTLSKVMGDLKGCNVSLGNNNNNFVNSEDYQLDFSLPKEDEEDPAYPVVKIRDGTLKGFTMKSITGREFKGFRSIPYAKPPVEGLRFQPPLKNSPWSGIRDAMSESPTCIQADFMQQYRVHGEEDCLYLNVYTPKLPSKSSKSGNPLPVMVFIHGGGWFFSTSSLYGPSYLLDEDVVLVTMNYRLSMFGFLSTGDEIVPGNNGLKDQVLALQWVRDNIAEFGGDPEKVTIFGESAGASSVHFHMVSPLSKGLFHRAISQSGCATCFWSISERAAETSRKFAKVMNCSTESSEGLVECLRSKDAKDLATMQLALLEWNMYPVVIFGPVVEPLGGEGAFLTDLPENIYKQGGVAQVPWISGFNRDEGAINIAALFVSDSIKQVNTEWDKYGPLLLDLKNTEENFKEILGKVRTFYLGEEGEVTLENKGDLVKMFSDRYVINCGVKGIQLHAAYSPEPVYAYRLGYKGKYGVVQLLGEKAEQWGASHMDDLLYLFNNTEYYPNLNLEDEEYQVSRIMVKLWTNFAKEGKPSLSLEGDSSSSSNEIIEWRPVDKNVTLLSPIDYLDINLKPEMIKDPFHQRVRFWRNLELTDP